MPVEILIDPVHDPRLGTGDSVDFPAEIPEKDSGAG